MIIIKSRYQKKKGSGIGNIFNKAVSSAIVKHGLNKIVNKVTTPAILQKVGDVAVNGALSSTQEAVKNKLKRSLNDQLKKKTKKQKIDEILGSGIVLD